MRIIPSSVPRVKIVEVANPELGSSWWTEGMVVGDEGGKGYRLRLQGFLYCLVDFRSPLIDPMHGDPRS